MRRIVQFSTTCYFDFKEYYLYRNGKEKVFIHGYRYNLLKRLTENPRIIFSRETLMSCKPNYNPDDPKLICDRSIDMQISILRAYDEAMKAQIITVSGEGYKYDGARPIEIEDEELPRGRVNEVEEQTGSRNSAGKREELSTPQDAAGTDAHTEAKEHKTYDMQAPVGPGEGDLLGEKLRILFVESLKKMVRAKTAEEVIGLIKGLNKHYLVISNDMLREILAIISAYDMQISLDEISVLEEVRIFIAQLCYRLSIRILEAELDEKRNEMERARTALDEENFNRLQLRIKRIEGELEEKETELASLQSSSSIKKP